MHFVAQVPDSEGLPYIQEEMARHPCLVSFKSFPVTECHELKFVIKTVIENVFQVTLVCV